MSEHGPSMAVLDAPPADLDAERSVIGACMLDARIVDDVAEILTDPTDWYAPTHEALWGAIAALHADGRPCDPITVRAHLEDTGQTRAAGGTATLADCIGAVTVTADAVEHARIVRDRAVQRRTIQAAARIHQLASQPGGDVSAMVSAAQATLDAVEPGAGRPVPTLGELLPGVIDRIGVDDLAGLPTPWPDLNRHLHGLAPGRLHVIGARPGVGKSLMAQGLAEHWSAHHHQRVLLASCEMPARELVLRMVARNSGVSLSTIIDGRHLSERDWEAIAKAAKRLEAALDLLHIEAASSQSVDSIRTQARRMHRHGGLGLIVVDYLQLLTPPPARRRDRNREQEVAETSRRFKELAMELDVPIVLLSQLNRALASRADKRPTLTDLRESGAIEQDSDVILLMHLPDEDSDSALDVSIAKNRSGPPATIHLIRQGWIANLASTDTRHEGAA